jgi:hypothetical protein
VALRWWCLLLWSARLRTRRRRSAVVRKSSVRDVTGWITRHPGRLIADDAQRLEEILARVRYSRVPLSTSERSPS